MSECRGFASTTVGLRPWLPWPLCDWHWWTVPVRAERLAAHSLFRSGACSELLESLIAETGTHDLVALEWLWWDRRYPLVLYGGYADFREFYRSAQPQPQLSA